MGIEKKIIEILENIKINKKDNIWTATFEDDEIKESNKLIDFDSNTEFQDIGIDSLDFIELIILIEEELEIEFPDDKLIFNELNTVKKIVDVISNII